MMIFIRPTCGLRFYSETTVHRPVHSKHIILTLSQAVFALIPLRCMIS